MEEHKEGDDAYVHLRVPAELKARWIRESRAVGLKLTDWIVSRVEARQSSVACPDERDSGR